MAAWIYFKWLSTITYFYNCLIFKILRREKNILILFACFQRQLLGSYGSCMLVLYIMTPHILWSFNLISLPEEYLAVFTFCFLFHSYDQEIMKFFFKICSHFLVVKLLFNYKYPPACKSACQVLGKTRFFWPLIKI